MHKQYNIQVVRAKRCCQRDASSSCVRIGLLFGSLVIALGLVLIPGFISNYNSGLIDTQFYSNPTSPNQAYSASNQNSVARQGVVSTFGKHE